jgi:hypothetical protein
MYRKHVGLLLLVTVLLLPRYSISACKTDCRDEYQSAKEDCTLTYDDPDDADDLQMCLQDAKAAYEDCIEECES